MFVSTERQMIDNRSKREQRTSNAMSDLSLLCQYRQEDNANISLNQT